MKARSHRLQRRRPANYGRRCVRCWFRHEGRVVRMLHINDYRPCENGGEPRLFVKLIDHTRYARGVHLGSDDWWGTVLPVLLPGQWVELIIQSRRAAA